MLRECDGFATFTPLQVVCGGDQTLSDVPDEDYYEACKLTDLMGKKAIEICLKMKK